MARELETPAPGMAAAAARGCRSGALRDGSGAPRARSTRCGGVVADGVQRQRLPHAVVSGWDKVALAATQPPSSAATLPSASSRNPLQLHAPPSPVRAAAASPRGAGCRIWLPRALIYAGVAVAWSRASAALRPIRHAAAEDRWSVVLLLPHRLLAEGAYSSGMVQFSVLGSSKRKPSLTRYRCLRRRRPWTSLTP
ncbi:hypothetical protein C2845_PM05G37460 [Panicum miliaceum]|uniref:Uncharacterized protein n=1 Tax=Panicum miliaceum TaxID=4540 RepID=A0A3L6SYC9_PANMI|nr:hypothetical protein C2845_PM05G37460 [Panicum miliaceum]